MLPRERGEVEVDTSTDGDRDGGGDDERALVAAAQADPRAFGPLYRRYLTRVYRFVRAQTSNDDDAADITQQVFLRALSALPAYRLEGAPFSAWLFRIARHAAIDARRRQRPSVAWDRLPEALTPEGERDPEETYLRAEALTRLRKLVAALDADKRELLALRFAGRLSSAEIADVVGKRPEAVRKMLTRTLHALKEHYHEA